MRHLQKIIAAIILSITLYACSSSPTKDLINSKEKDEKPVVIANDTLEYKVIIFDIGFNYYLASQARPVGFYSQNYLENWNNIYVINWNLRVQNPTRYDSTLYANIIDYDSKTDYGMDVNYKLFNYFQFAQQKYKMRLDTESTNVVRIR